MEIAAPVAGTPGAGLPARDGGDVRRRADAEPASVAEPGEAQFREFVELRWHALLRFGYLLTGDWAAAEDLTQAALESTWRRWGRIRVENPEQYVKAAMANRMKSRWRRRTIEVADGVTRERAVAADHPADHALRDALWSALMDLPPRMRAVIVLRIWEDLSEAETARLLNCSIGTVKSQASRGMQRLRLTPDVLEAAGRSAGGTSPDGLAAEIRGSRR